MLLHVCHSSWVAHTGGLVGCSCANVTRCGWHVLESPWWYTLACVSLTVGGMHWSCNARRRAHQGRTLGCKSLGGTTVNTLVLIREMWKGRDVEFYSMYLIEYKSPLSPHMCLIKNPPSQSLGFCIFGMKDLSRKNSTTLGLECTPYEVELQVGGIPCSWDCFAIQLL